MKKQLLACTALVAAAMLAAGGASAQDKKMADKKKMMKPSISINGSFEAVVGGLLDDNLDTKYSYRPVRVTTNTDAIVFADNATALPPSSRPDLVDTSAVDTRSDAEIHFNGNAELDNGLKIHARVELEGGNSPADPVDEHFLSLSGAFGNLVLGGTSGAPARMMTGMSGSFATGVGESLAYDLNGWSGTVAGGAYAVRDVRLDTGDAEKITFISPKLGGFQLGVTYSPERAGDDTTGRIDAARNVHDGLEAAFTFDGKFGDVGFGVGAAMTAYQGANMKATGSTCVATPGADATVAPTTTCPMDSYPNADLSDWAVAGRLDFGGGFRVAAGYKSVTDDDKSERSSIVDAGLRFVAGANQFSVTGSYGEMEQSGANHTALMGSYARTLGSGVVAHVNLAWTESEGGPEMTDAQYNVDRTLYEDGAPANTDYIQQYGKKEQSAIMFITGIKVTF